MPCGHQWNSQLQVEACKLRDYGGDYDIFLEKNTKEAATMSEKLDKQKELQKSQIKAKSKVSCNWSSISFDCPQYNDLNGTSFNVMLRNYSTSL